MQRQLKNTVDPQLRTDILLNLKDLHEDTPQGLSFSIRLFEAAYNSHDAYAASVALHPIVTRFSTYGEKRDSLKYYLEQFHHITRFTDQAEMSFFYHTLSQFEVFNIKGSSKKSLLDLCDSIRAEQKPIPNGTTGQKIGRLFLIGYTGWYQRVLTGEKNCGIGSIGVWKEAWILARQLPPNAKRSFMSLIYRYLSSGYTQAHNYQGVLRIAKDYIGALDDYYQSETVRRRRPFLYKDNLYVIAYTHMMRGALYIGDKELAYRHYQNLEHRLLSAKGDALRRNKIYLYESGAMLLSDLNRQEEAISYCDSLITMIENGQAGSYNRETIYRHRALLLHRSGRDEESCQAYERSMAVSDSMLTSEYNSRLDAIRQDRQVDSLRLDEVHLVVRSRYTQLLALMGLLLISIIVGIYWLYSLRANRKLQQEILRQNHKAQESERMKSAFIHSICKDIHIPFNKIREAARQLTQPHQIDPVTVQVYRESIYDNTKHLLSILDTLLETAKLDSLSEGLSLQITDMAAICQAEIDMARHRSKRAKVNFQCIIDDDECLAFTHPQYATFVIRSLLSNAEKFTKEGSITLHCRHLTDQNCMQITVTDTGCGIPADKYEYIFEKFAKLDTATIGGGLSLALCRQIAQQLHSTLSIDPSYTTGARFVFTLPLPPPPPKMNKKHTYLTLCILACILFPSTVIGQMTLRDSLQAKLPHASQLIERTELLLNILDLSENEEQELPIARRLYHHALRTNDTFALGASLGTMVIDLVGDRSCQDSLFQLLENAEVIFKGSAEEGLSYYYRMVYLLRDIPTNNQAQCIQKCNQLLHTIHTKPPQNDYERASQFFITACINYTLAAETETPCGPQVVADLESAWQLAQTFPYNSRKNFCCNIYTMLSHLYNINKETDKLIQISNIYLAILDQFFALPTVTARRPYIYKDNYYLLCYQQLMLNEETIGKEKAERYFRLFQKFMRHGRGDVRQRDKFYLYTYSYNYYEHKKAYPEALLYVDSLITQIEQRNGLNTKHAVYYQSRAETLRKMGRYSDACEAYARAQVVADSLTHSAILETTSRMQVDSEINQMGIDRAQISAHNEQIALYCSIGLLLIAAGYCVYIYRRVKQTERLQQTLVYQRQQADANESKKTDFINSICHEVRTPLNSIYGFSELIVDEKDVALRKEYTDVINENCSRMTVLLKDMLEVTNLTNLMEPLLLQDDDITTLCRRAVSLQIYATKKSRIRLIEGPSIPMHTNTHYFILLIRSLLNNAVKFAPQGEITLTWTKVANSKNIQITVTDCGCGIPLEEQEHVFERFVKLNSFSQGNGLGLYLCRLIAQALKGEIHIDPSYTNGTRVVFTLPPDPEKTGKNKIFVA